MCFSPNLSDFFSCFFHTITVQSIDFPKFYAAQCYLLPWQTCRNLFAMACCTKPLFFSATMSLMRKCLQLSARNVSLTSSRTFINSDGFKKWAFEASGFNQYGLYHDDALNESDDVKVNIVLLNSWDFYAADDPCIRNH